MFNKNGEDTATPPPPPAEEAVTVSRELAEQEFYQFCKVNGIDVSVLSQKEEGEKSGREKEQEQKAFNTCSEGRRRFIRACMEGRLVRDGRDLIYTVSPLSSKHAGEKATLSPPGGGAVYKSLSDGNDNPVHVLHNLLSAMTGKPVTWFGQVDLADWNFFSAMAALFQSA